MNSSNPSVQSKMALTAAAFLCDSDARTQVSVSFKNTQYLGLNLCYMLYSGSFVVISLICIF